MHPAMRILIASGFFESALPSYREYSYSKELSAIGHDVTLLCGNQSQAWRFSRVRLPATFPHQFDNEFCRNTSVRLMRRRVFFRFSDFVLYIPSISAIRQADVVHVIEFRQGVTLIVALIARVFGKPVVYDHEQRGDRRSRWYSRVDSAFRRTLIYMGSWCVDCVRHTVIANRDHFKSCTRREVETMFAPLGTDPEKFYYDKAERRITRAELGLDDGVPAAVMSGKLHGLKRITDVVKACRAAKVRLILIGSMTRDVEEEIAAIGPGEEIILGSGDSHRLRAIYCAADIAIFTTFTLSYWEAYSTGIQLVVPESAFSKIVFSGDVNVARFGKEAMFRVPDEEYLPEVSIVEPLVSAIAALPGQVRSSSSRFAASTQTAELSRLYSRLVAARSPGHAE